MIAGMHHWLLPEIQAGSHKRLNIIAFDNPLSCFLCNFMLKSKGVALSRVNQSPRETSVEGLVQIDLSIFFVRPHRIWYAGFHEKSNSKHIGINTMKEVECDAQDHTERRF